MEGGCVARNNPSTELCPSCKTKPMHIACWHKIPMARESYRVLGIRGACSAKCLLQLLHKVGSDAAKALRGKLIEELEKEEGEGERTRPAPASVPPSSARVEVPPAPDKREKKRRAPKKKDKDKPEAEAEERPRPPDGLHYSADGAVAFESLEKWVLQSQPKYSLSGTVEENEKYRRLLLCAALYTKRADVVKHNNRAPVLLRSRAYVSAHVDELKADFARGKLSDAVLVVEDGAESETLKPLVGDDKLSAAKRMCAAWLKGDISLLKEEIEGGAAAKVYAFTLCGNHSTAALASLVSYGVEASGERPAYVYFRSQLSDADFSFLAGHENALESQRSQLTANYTAFAEPLHVIPFIRDLWVEKGRPAPLSGREYAGASTAYHEFQETLNR